MHPEVDDVVSRVNRGDEGWDRDETEELRQTLHRYRAVYEKLAQG